MSCDMTARPPTSTSPVAPAGQSLSPAYCSLCLQDGRRVDLCLHVCDTKDAAQAVVRLALGYLPSDLTDCFWRDGDTIHIAIQASATPGRIAHEAFHAASSFVSDPNDYTLVRPDGGDFGFIPAEVAADLCEQIVDAIHSANADYPRPHSGD